MGAAKPAKELRGEISVGVASVMSFLVPALGGLPPSGCGLVLMRSNASGFRNRACISLMFSALPGRGFRLSFWGNLRNQTA